MLVFKLTAAELGHMLAYNPWFSTRVAESPPVSERAVHLVYCVRFSTNVYQFVRVLFSRLVLREGCGIWLYEFLVIAFPFTLTKKKIGCGKLKVHISVIQGFTKTKMK